VIENLRKHSATLVEQAQMVSQELVRVAILWNEMWHEGLEDASRFHFAGNFAVSNFPNFGRTRHRSINSTIATSS
jgi:phosphatidylinositol kinase/protein kinase (PI-3  family)